MNQRSLARISALFTVLFLVLAARFAWLQLVVAPQISANRSNPRRSFIARDRGRILAADGSVLAATDGTRRVYPMGSALAQVVGYASRRYGTAGLERAYDELLAAPSLSANPLQQVQHLIDSFHHYAPQSGDDLITTIEPKIERRLADLLARHARAAGIVLDPRTGAVLAIASTPSFDPNTMGKTFSRALHAKDSPLLDRALEGLYPPGSTFKMLTASAAVDSGRVGMHDVFQDPGYLMIGKARLHDNDYEATGAGTIVKAFALSSNVDFAQIVLRTGSATFYRYLRRFGVGGSLDFQLPTARAFVPAESQIWAGELAQMGFGQGALLVTPMQIATIAATIANGGVEERPFIVRAIARHGKILTRTPVGPLGSPVSAQTAAKVTKMMEAVVAWGTGTSAQIPGVTVAGKTGTATNPHGAPDSWFVCFAPAEAPRVVVAIVVENAGYGAAVAAPIAREVLARSLTVITK